jgi:hypothetical protein
LVFPRRLAILGCLLLSAGFAGNAHAETLQAYVTSCQQQLQFQSVPELSCYDGELFNPTESGEVIIENDYVVYSRITNNVDLTAACRWLFGSKQAPSTCDTRGTGPGNGPCLAQSVEMFVHNRVTGGTCFFEAKARSNVDDINRVPPTIVSITSPAASTYWAEPEVIGNPSGDFGFNNRQCVTCHIKGPYIVTRRIAPFLAKLGILNNGHDNYRERYHAAVPNGASALAHFNDIIHGTVDHKKDGLIVDDGIPNVALGCSGACHHRVASDFPRLTVVGILPSIHDAFEFFDPTDPTYPFRYQQVSALAMMPPTFDPNSPYRWLNDDSLDLSGDVESFSALKNPDTDPDVNNTPRAIYESCEWPTLMEARAVGSNFTFSTSDVFPDVLQSFSAVEGLNCVNNQQSDGACGDYETRYFCPGGAGYGPYWTHAYGERWYDVDDPTFSADNESRQALASVGITLCGGQEPLDIQARTKVGSSVYSHIGPRDRLANFAPDRLECFDSDQPDFSFFPPGVHECSNYTVRYTYCSGDEVPNPNFFEIVVDAKLANGAPVSVGPMNVYVDDVPLRRFDQPVGVTDTVNFNRFTYRTNATGELRIVTEDSVFVGDVTVNGLTRLPLEKTIDPDEKIVVRARGTSGDEVIRVTVAGQEIAVFDLTTAWDEYVTYTDIYGGVNVEFINDASGRDVQLDWVRINGQYRQTEDQTYNTATWNSSTGSCSGGRGDVMHCGSNWGNFLGVIGFGNVSNASLGTTERSYGHVSHLPMPDVATVVDITAVDTSGYCAQVVARNTTNSTKNISFLFDTSSGPVTTTSGFQGQEISETFQGFPNAGMPQTLGPHQGSDAASFGFCALFVP